MVGRRRAFDPAKIDMLMRAVLHDPVRIVVKGSVLCVVFFAGCMALPQVNILPSTSDFSAFIDKRECLSVRWKRSSLSSREKPELDSAASFVLSDSGKRFSVKFQENPYTVDDRNWVQGFLMLLEGNEKGQTELVRWTNGHWHLHLEFTKKVKKDPIEVDIDISTFNYNPIIHGPPN